MKLRFNLRLILSLLAITFIGIFYQNCSDFSASGNGDPNFTSSSIQNDQLPTPPTQNDRVPTSPNNEINFAKQRGKVQAPASKLRLLNGPELMNTIESITRYKVLNKLDFVDKSTGFITGDNLTLDANTFRQIMTTTNLAITEYLRSKAKEDFTCLNKTFQQSCYNQVITGFAEKSYRRPLTSKESSELMTLYNKVNTDLGDNQKIIAYGFK